MEPSPFSVLWERLKALMALSAVTFQHKLGCTSSWAFNGVSPQCVGDEICGSAVIQGWVLHELLFPPLSPSLPPSTPPSLVTNSLPCLICLEYIFACQWGIRILIIIAEDLMSFSHAWVLMCWATLCCTMGYTLAITKGPHSLKHPYSSVKRSKIIHY